MKLGALNAAIDAAKGKVKVAFHFGHVAQEKGDLKAMLKAAFESKATETHLRLVPEGDYYLLQYEPGYEKLCRSCGGIA
jgi:hypothetical protein